MVLDDFNQHLMLKSSHLFIPQFLGQRIKRVVIKDLHQYSIIHIQSQDFIMFRGSPIIYHLYHLLHKCYLHNRIHDLREHRGQYKKQMYLLKNKAYSIKHNQLFYINHRVLNKLSEQHKIQMNSLHQVQRTFRMHQ